MKKLKEICEDKRLSSIALLCAGALMFLAIHGARITPGNMPLPVDGPSSLIVLEDLGMGMMALGLIGTIGFTVSITSLTMEETYVRLSPGITWVCRPPSGPCLLFGTAALACTCTAFFIIPFVMGGCAIACAIPAIVNLVAIQIARKTVPKDLPPLP